MKIILVDDDAISTQVIGALLSDRGHEVKTRTSALGTSAEIMREKPDLLLVDVNMPGLSGDQIVTLMQDSGRENPMLVLYSSADDLAEIAGRCGADGFIHKTGDHDEFLKSFDVVTRRLSG